MSSRRTINLQAHNPHSGLKGVDQSGSLHRSIRGIGVRHNCESFGGQYLPSPEVWFCKVAKLRDWNLFVSVKKWVPTGNYFMYRNDVHCVAVKRLAKTNEVETIHCLTHSNRSHFSQINLLGPNIETCKATSTFFKGTLFQQSDLVRHLTNWNLIFLIYFHRESDFITSTETCFESVSKHSIVSNLRMFM